MIRIILILLSLMPFVTNASEQKVGEEPFSIDGYTKDWKNVEGITFLDFRDLDLDISHGLQREVYYRDNGQTSNKFHDAISIRYIRDSPRFKAKELLIKIRYLDRNDGTIQEISRGKYGWGPEEYTITIEANPNMVAYGDVYDQAFSSEGIMERIEVLLPARIVSPSSIPFITVAIKGEDSTDFKDIYDGKQITKPRGYQTASWFSDEDSEYSLTISIVGSVGPISKGFQFATNIDDFSLSVVDGYNAGSVASFQGEIGVWNSGDLAAIANGKSFGTTFETPAGSYGLVSNGDGSIKGISIAFGPAIGLPMNISQYYSQELASTYRERETESDISTDRTREDDDRDRNDYDREREDDDRDRDFDDRDGPDAIETDLDSRETIEIDFPDRPGFSGDID
ncbi:hypothetical protein VH1709_contig00021-0016 [Vibrio harveyi]|nr:MULTISPECIES: hypothetical protein [Vibrio]ELH7813045.1 hypothetical protein [Vibrio harveyi]KNY43107.1 hypothetical protein AKG94_16450 [Vibrio harveyi]CAH1547251.1 exported protein of unknown function [Vibrio harveyi]GBK98016.1 hypothetical protein VH1709_contig00021-0016 [Vibrio harveyi]GEA21761.1 hypothetical protein VH1807_contig00017-0019 [Vibrio harveyi]